MTGLPSTIEDLRALTAFAGACPTRPKLEACRADEPPMLQFWFATGLRPGELQALEWRHIA